MPRRKRTPEEIARKERTKALMKELNIKDMDDIQDLFKSFVAAALEGGLEAELDEELGYSKYDYRNKETNNSRNGYSKKTMKTSFGDMDIDIPRDAMVILSLSLFKNIKQHYREILKKKSYQCMLKE